MTKYLSREILIEDPPTAHFRKERSQSKEQEDGLLKKKQRLGRTSTRPEGSHVKTIKVPPPTINPYNTMSHLKSHAKVTSRQL